MPSQLVGTNAIVTANHFNPSILSQLWLMRNGLVGEGEFEKNCIFSDDMAQVRTADYAILALRDQLQFAPSTDATEERQQQLIMEKLCGIVERLPETPYSSAGINFLWHVTADDGDPESMSRRIFYRDETPLFAHFAAQDARFGGYLSVDALGSRLRLDIKPIIDPETKVACLWMAFNFQRNLEAFVDSPDRVGQIVEMMGRWRDTKRRAVEIVRSVQTGE